MRADFFNARVHARKVLARSSLIGRGVLITPPLVGPFLGQKVLNLLPSPGVQTL